jgi:hypothetical protein
MSHRLHTIITYHYHIPLKQTLSRLVK